MIDNPNFLGGGTWFTISGNPNISVCNYESVCQALSNFDPNGFFSPVIGNNAPGCNSIPEVALECGIPLPNDECVDAIELIPFLTIVASNIGATQSPQIPSCNDSANRIDVWFSFIADFNPNTVITVNGGVYNLQLWEGDCSNLSPVPNACGVNFLSPQGLNGGSTYYIQVWSDELDRASGIFDLTLAFSLSVEEDSLQKVSLFPNPTNSILNFEAKDIVDQITIFNAIGQEMVTITPNEPNGLIDLSDFSSGLYFVRVGIGEKNKTFKVLKE